MSHRSTISDDGFAPKPLAWVIAALLIWPPALAVLPASGTAQPHAILPRHPMVVAPSQQADATKNQESPSAAALKNAGKLNERKAAADLANEAGGAWSVRWNSNTGSPHLATGKALRLQRTGHLTQENIEAAGREFVDSHADLLKVRAKELKLARATKAGGRWHATFQQMHDGVPVYGSTVTLSFTSDDRLLKFGADVYPDITVSNAPRLPSVEAVKSALQELRGTGANGSVASAPQLAVVPVVRPDGTEYVLCWQMIVEDRAAGLKREYLVSATDGGIVLHRDLIVHLAPLSGSVQVEYRPEYAGDAPLLGPSEYETVFAYSKEIPIQTWNLDADPGWSREGQWSFGQPSGRGGYEWGGPDPTSGHTGNNVFGVNLQGDYAPGPAGPYYLTTGPIDCSRSTSCWLRFWRWLNIEWQPLASASVEISTDGVNWATVWASTSEVTDSAWTECRYDISAWADRQSKVYIRWGYAVASQELYSAWNIDDVSIFSQELRSGSTSASGGYTVRTPGTECNIVSELKGAYAEITLWPPWPSAHFVGPPVRRGQSTSWAWDASYYQDPAEANVYRHVNFAHDYYKALDRAFNGLDYPMPVTVGVTGYPNAFWDGTGLLFGAGDGRYYGDFGLFADVIYHEYTHGVTDKIYTNIYFPNAMEGGALNEGLSDYFGCAMSRSGSGAIGENGLVLGHPEGLRSLENTYRRETDWNNEVHDDGRMFSAALWEARRMLGPALMDPLVHFARYEHPVDFEDYLVALLVEDDARYGDGDLSNGTPHARALYEAFGHHGIGGLQYLAPSLVVDDRQGNDDRKLDPGETVRLRLTLQNRWADARQIRATLTSDDPFVRLDKPRATFPNAAYGGLSDNRLDPFVITASPGCPTTHTINLRLEITAEGPYAYTRVCLLTCPVAVNQIAYDDGQMDTLLGWGPGATNAATAVRFTPDEYPSYPTHLRLYPSGIDPPTEITIKAWDDSGPGGTPGRELGSLKATPPAAGDWVDVDIRSLGLVIASGSIYVGWVEGTEPFWNGGDYDPPYSRRVYAFDTTVWYSLESLGFLANPMARLIYAPERPPQIQSPTQYTWTTGQNVSECLTAKGGTPPYRWDLLANPGYTWTVLPSSLFATTGVGRGWQEDDEIWPYTLPFPFAFYGTVYTSVNVCSNGFLDFTNDKDTASIGSTARLLERVRIAPLWGDVVTSAPGDIYIDESVPGQVTFRWDGVTYDDGTPVAFAAVLSSDGRIRFDYGPGNRVAKLIVALSNANQENFVVVPGYSGAASLDGVPSVLFEPQTAASVLPEGISLDPATGCLTGVPQSPGTHTGSIRIVDSSEPPRWGAASFLFSVVGCTLPNSPDRPQPADATSNCSIQTYLSWNGASPPSRPPRAATPGAKRSGTNLMVNGDFETGDLSGWMQLDSGGGGLGIDNGTMDPPGPDGPMRPCQGKYGVVSWQNYPGTHRLYQDIQLPAGPGTAVLSWTHAIHNQGVFIDPNQQFRVELRSPTDGALLKTAYTSEPYDLQTAGCVERSMDISNLLGTRVRVMFTEEDSNDYLNVRFDNVQLRFYPERCVPSFDVYLGTTNPPTARVAEELLDPWFNPKPLAPCTPYYWRVVAWDCCGREQPGPIWSFSTSGDPKGQKCTAAGKP